MEHSTNDEIKSVQNLTLKMIEDTLKLVSDDDLRLMGFESSFIKDKLFITKLVIPPLQIRPSIKIDTLQTTTNVKNIK